MVRMNKSVQNLVIMDPRILSPALSFCSKIEEKRRPENAFRNTKKRLNGFEMNFEQFLQQFREDQRNMLLRGLYSLQPEAQSQFLNNALKPAISQQEAVEIPINIFNELPDPIQVYLRNHQKDAINFIYNNIIQSNNGADFSKKNGGTGAIIAHNMGLGKTTTIVAFLYGILSNATLKQHFSRILIISPVNVIEHWIEEFKKDIWKEFFSTEARLCEIQTSGYTKKAMRDDFKRMQIGEWYKGEQNKKILILGYEMYDTLLTNSEEAITSKMLKEYLQNPGPDIVICDEGHRLKNNETKSYHIKKEMHTRRRILLTGTPIENGLEELYHVVNFARPNYFGNMRDYLKKYVVPMNLTKFTDASAIQKNRAQCIQEKLHKQLQNVIHRKDAKFLQEQMGITKKEITITFCETEEQKKLLDKIHEAYETAAPGDKNFWQYYYDLNYITSHPAIYAAKINSTKLTTNMEEKNPARSNKMLFLFEILESCCSNNEKLVVYALSLGTLDYIQDQLESKNFIKDKNFFRIDGNITPQDRANFLKKFNDEKNREARLFLLSTKTGSVGINLIGANRMILFDHGFNPVQNTQATYRIFRIGQTRDVFVYRFVTKNSGDDSIVRRQITKESQSKRVIDNKKIDPQFSEDQIKIKRGYENVDSITAEELGQIDDPFLISIIKNNMDVISEVTDHEKHFEENKFPVDREDFDEKPII